MSVGFNPSTQSSPKLLSFKMPRKVDKACSRISFLWAKNKSRAAGLLFLNLLKSNAEMTVLPVPVAATTRFLWRLCVVRSTSSFSRISSWKWWGVMSKKEAGAIAPEWDVRPCCNAEISFSLCIVSSNSSKSSLCQYESNVFWNLSIMWPTSLVVIFTFHSSPSVRAEREKFEDPM